MKLRAFLASAIVVASLSSVAAAGPVAEAGERAEDLLEDGQALEALDALNAAIDAVWEESPLLFREVIVVESSGGHGLYDEREDSVFRPDETLRVYVEPVGYGFGRSGRRSEIALSTDLAIRNTTGQVLVDEEDAFSVEVETAARKREFSMTLSFEVPYLRPGEYVGVFTVADENSDKTGTFEVPFTVAFPTEVSGTEDDPTGAEDATDDQALEADEPEAPAQGSAE